MYACMHVPTYLIICAKCVWDLPSTWPTFLFSYFQLLFIMAVRPSALGKMQGKNIVPSFSDATWKFCPEIQVRCYRVRNSLRFPPNAPQAPALVLWCLLRKPAFHIWPWNLLLNRKYDFTPEDGYLKGQKGEHIFKFFKIYLQSRVLVQFLPLLLMSALSSPSSGGPSKKKCELIHYYTVPYLYTFPQSALHSPTHSPPSGANWSLAASPQPCPAHCPPPTALTHSCLDTPFAHLEMPFTRFPFPLFKSSWWPFHSLNFYFTKARKYSF